MERLRELIKAIDGNASAIRSVGGILLGFVCLLIFIITIMRVDAASINTAHVLILVLALVAFLVPWIEKFTWSKDGGSIEFKKRDDAIEALNQKMNFLSEISNAVHSSQTPREVEVLRSSQTSTTRPTSRRKRGSYKARFKDVAFDALVDMDPNKGEFGTTSSASATIEAKVKHVSGEWYQVSIEVKAKKGKHLPAGEVTFYLHPTFAEPELKAPIANDRAVLEIGAWGSFTIGAELPNGESLELDLAKDVPGVPRDFVE